MGCGCHNMTSPVQQDRMYHGIENTDNTIFEQLMIFANIPEISYALVLLLPPATRPKLSKITSRAMLLRLDKQDHSSALTAYRELQHASYEPGVSTSNADIF